jgi:hypothetical protein
MIMGRFAGVTPRAFPSHRPFFLLLPHCRVRRRCDDRLTPRLLGAPRLTASPSLDAPGPASPSPRSGRLRGRRGAGMTTPMGGPRGGASGAREVRSLGASA